jgi:hypothetical protein
MLALGLAACAAPIPPPAPVDHYRDSSAWLCLPGRAGDACDMALDTTVIAADGSRSVVAVAAAAQPDVDCFYVYPTVDLSWRAGNHDDFSDTTKIANTTRSQAVRFRQLCALYVPLYRQVTIGTYLHGGDRLRDGLDLAYSDVAAAFRSYLANHNHGRRIVLIGHSQGAEMVKRLLGQFFDQDASLRARLVLALPLGGDLEVPARARAGGTFQHLPACHALGETGCVVGFRSYREGADIASPTAPMPAGHESLCVDPARVDDSATPAALDAVYLRSDRLHGVDGITTPFVSYPGLYLAHCAAGPDGARVLAIENATGNARAAPVDLSAKLLSSKQLGTHILDFQIAQDNLLELVRRAAAHGPS